METRDSLKDYQGLRQKDVKQVGWEVKQLLGRGNSS